MHPRYTHTPPGFGSVSTRTTWRPRSAARNAPAYPPGPPPTTTSCVEIMTGAGRERQDWRDLQASAGLHRTPRPTLPALPARPAPRSSLHSENVPVLNHLDEPAQEPDADGAGA